MTGGDIISCGDNIFCEPFLIYIPIYLSKLLGFVDMMDFPVGNGKLNRESHNILKQCTRIASRTLPDHS